MCEGIAKELEGINLGDKRLNRRSGSILESLAANPQASINSACDGWSDTLIGFSRIQRLCRIKSCSPTWRQPSGESRSTLSF